VREVRFPALRRKQSSRSAESILYSESLSHASAQEHDSSILQKEPSRARVIGASGRPARRELRHSHRAPTGVGSGKAGSKCALGNTAEVSVDDLLAGRRARRESPAVSKTPSVLAVLALHFLRGLGSGGNGPARKAAQAAAMSSADRAASGWQVCVPSRAPHAREEPRAAEHGMLATQRISFS